MESQNNIRLRSDEIFDFIDFESSNSIVFGFGEFFFNATKDTKLCSNIRITLYGKKEYVAFAGDNYRLYQIFRLDEDDREIAVIYQSKHKF